MTPSPAALAVRYAVFAAIATGVNITTQYGCDLAYTGRFDLPVAMAFGTGTGLVAKYLLDKRYIFLTAPARCAAIGRSSRAIPSPGSRRRRSSGRRSWHSPHSAPRFGCAMSALRSD